ncbi:hypothetical protein [Agromyces mariniharenae]|uniref:Uncharacterized protein n=1 Tax=Agromyces mariniharenae TaxID=2604423 RepID=A0A5S4UX91_9MICO|nr:hypothetical protein [Agromyces mariniharenae]TYL51186.1 hypothetical protein FYC51_18900 [Agromyces mariniharenae]
MLAAVVAAVVTAALLVACSPAEASGTGSVDVRAGQDATVTAGSDGELVVEVPGSSIKGEGTLVAKPTEGAQGVEGWSVELAGGAELIGPATLRFKHAFEDGEPLPLVASTSDGETYEAAEDVVADDAGIVVTTTHFSNWFTMWWDDLMEKARAGLDFIYQDAGKPPTCDGEDAVRTAGYEISSDSGDRVYWCLGQGSSGGAGLTVVNGRGYTVAAEHTPGLAVTDAGATDLLGMLSNLIKETPSLPQNTVTLVGPGSTIQYSVDGSQEMGVRLKPSVAGYLVTAAQYAVDTVLEVLKYAGKADMSVEKVADLFEWESCLTGFSSMATSDIETATQASDYFSDAVGTTLGCMDDALKNAGLAFRGTTVAGSLSWLIAGVRTALNGLGAAADTALNPNGYSIYISPPAPILPGLPADLSGKWCTRTGEQECFDAAETLAKYPQAFVDESYPDASTPGTTTFVICLQPDLGDSCSVAGTMLLEYFPAGVAWDCVATQVEGAGWPACTPDYTDAHYSSEPRLVHQYNHQQDETYHDAPPMYRTDQ